MYIPKFRAKIKRTKERLPIEEFDYDDKEVYVNAELGYCKGYWISFKKIKFEQFTTEKDHKGFEIYVGDLVTVKNYEIGNIIPFNFRGEVKFVQGGFYVVNDELELMFPVWQEITKWEVVGVS